MCRADVAPQAATAAALLLRAIAQKLADEAGIDVDQLRVGPVDLGPPDGSRPTA